MNWVTGCRDWAARWWRFARTDRYGRTPAQRKAARR